MAVLIADTACVDPRAEIAQGAEIGAFCVVGPRASIGRGAKLSAHSCVVGQASVGAETVVQPLAVLGVEGEEDAPPLAIGEGARIGAGAHVAPGCRVGDRASLGSGVVLAPGVSVGEGAVVSGPARVDRDIPPYVACRGPAAEICGWNEAELERSGIAPADIESLREALRLVEQPGMIPEQAIALMRNQSRLTPEAKNLLSMWEGQPEITSSRGRARERPVAS